LAARRSGDTLVVTKLDRLARSVPDARAIAEEFDRRSVRFSLGGAVSDPTIRWGAFSSTRAIMAEFEADLVRTPHVTACGWPAWSTLWPRARPRSLPFP